MKLETPIYFDYSSTTPVDPRVLEKMLPFFTEKFGNPASTHQWGWTTQHAVKKAREQVAALIHCRPDEITFTSSCTESNNWLLIKIAEDYLAQGPVHFISTQIEHSSVTKVLDYLESKGVEITRLAPTDQGVVKVSDFVAAIKPHTKLASIIWVQNELGTVQPIEEIARICHEKQIYIHSDATQSVGKLPVDLQKIPLSFLSFSGHKLYAPKGIGVLFHRQQNPKTRLSPLLFGGGHENGLRSSTLNVASIVGLGEACEICSAELQVEQQRLTALRDLAWKNIQRLYTQARLNGSGANRCPSTIHFTLRGAPIEGMLPGLLNLGLSQGAACGASSASISPVLKALNFPVREAQESFRLSLGRFSTEKEVLEGTEFLCYLANSK